MSTTLFTGGTVRTGRGQESADWALVEDGRIEAVGRGHAPSAERHIDLESGTLVPAFRDAHVHLPATGLYEQGMDFRGETSARRILDAFRSRAEEGALLFAGNFEDPLDEPLLAEQLDAAVGSNRALLVRADMHSCVASSALLHELEIERAKGVDRDEGGRPTGFLREQAASEAWRWFEGNLPRRQQLDAIRSAVRLAYSKGIAEVHEMFVVEWRGWDSAEIFAEAVAGVALDVAPYFGTDEVSRVVDMGLPRIGGDWFLDGSFGSHTAWMNEPFETEPPPGSSPTGISYRDDDEVFEFFFEAQEAGLKVAVHAIGDAAIEQCISSWERVADKVGEESVRKLGHRIEHFECATDLHIRRAAALGLRPSVQPAFDWFWGGREGLYSQRIGVDRALKMNRFRSMLDAGLVLAAGSDSTVTPLDPFLQMASLREHHVEDERLDAVSALELNTFGPAAANGHAHIKGRIEEGLQADVVWLDRDPLTTSGEDLLRTEVLGTWIEGRRVWPQVEAETE